MTLREDRGNVANFLDQIEERLQIHIAGEGIVSHSPEVTNGEHVAWRNPTERCYAVVFDKSKCPFAEKTCIYTVLPGQYQISPAINGATGTYKYQVRLSEANPLMRVIKAVLKALGVGRHGNGKGDPVIIIKG